MKKNNLLKIFLSLLITLTITCTNTNLIIGLELDNYDSQIELFVEDGEDSPYIPRPRQ